MQFNIEYSYKSLNEKIEKLTSKQEEVICESVSKALEKVKLEVNKWMKIDDTIVVFSDLKNSTGISFDKQDRTMTKLLEYLNNPFIEIHNNFGAEFVEIKGDGGIAIYSKENAIKALLASISIKTYYERYISKKVYDTYSVSFEVTIGIAKGNLKLKNIGQRGLNFPVWAGKPINLAALISKELKKKKPPTNHIGITADLYKEIEDKDLQEYIYLSCGCPEGRDKQNLWKVETIPNNGGKKYHYMNNSWCKIHGQDYLDEIIKKINFKKNQESL